MSPFTHHNNHNNHNDDNDDKDNNHINHNDKQVLGNRRMSHHNICCTEVVFRRRQIIQSNRKIMKRRGRSWMSFRIGIMNILKAVKRTRVNERGN